MYEIGEKSDSSRPIKLFRKSQSDRNLLLNSTRQSKESSKYASIRYDRWLRRKNLNKLNHSGEDVRS